MKKLLQSLNERARDFACWHIAGLLNWVGDHIIAPAAEANPDEDTAMLRFGWWLDAQLGRLHSVFYPGSGSEAQDAIDAGIPAQYMSERQRAIALDAFTNPVASCNACQWVGFIHQAPTFECPSCGSDSIYWDDRSRAWVPYTDHRALIVLPRCSLAKGGAS